MFLRLKSLASQYHPYIVALALVAYALAGFYTHQLTWQQALQPFLYGLGVSSVAKTVKQNA